MASGSEKRQRQRRVVVRVSAEEWTALQERAEHARLTLASYARTTLLNTPAPPPRRQRQPVKDGEALARLLAHLGKIGSNINQLAHAAHLDHWPEARLHEEARQDIRAMRDWLMQALGVHRKDKPAP